MPFITEEIYTKLYNNDESIMISSWPKYTENLNFEKEEKQIDELKDIIVGIRNVRTTNKVHPSKKSKLIFVTKNLRDMIINSKELIQKLGFANEIVIEDKKENLDENMFKNAVSILTKETEVYIPLEDLVNIEEEKQRLEQEITRLEAEVQRASKMLSNPGFVNKAPEAKINEEKEKLAKYEDMLKATKERLENL